MEYKFKNKITINNRIYGKINNIDLMGIEIIIPNEQRLKDDLKIQEIIDYQNGYFKQNCYYNFMGVINIHLHNNSYYLVDGQHRYFAIKTLTNQGHKKIEIMVELVKIDDLHVLKHNYELINKNTELPEFPESIDKNIPESVAHDFFDRYENIWSNTKRTRRPHINKNNFQESLGVITEKLGITETHKLKQIIETYNDKLKYWPFSNFPGYKTFKDHNKIEEKCRKTGLYLGLFPFKDDGYGYGWVKSILHEYTGKEIKIRKPNFKIKLPQKVRIDSWNNYIGEDIGSVLCICCNQSKITQSNFQAGHITPKSKGGSDTIDNIIPICSQCNGSMMTKNMEDYIKEYYPNNYSNFMNKTYTTNNTNNTNTNNTNTNTNNTNTNTNNTNNTNKWNLFGTWN